MQAPARLARDGQRRRGGGSGSTMRVAPVLRTQPVCRFPAYVAAHFMNDMPSDTRPSSEHDQTMTLPIIGEVAKVSKVEVETGRLEVNKSVEQRVETIDTPTTRERYVVERCWINRVVESGVQTAVRQEGDTTIFPVLEEIVVVEKRLVLKEELRVTKVLTQSHSTQTVTLRTERADVTRHGAETQAAGTGNEQ